MSTYTNDQLIKRDMIIQTHKQFITFLNANVINRLVHLFKDGASNTNSEKIRTRPNIHSRSQMNTA